MSTKAAVSSAIPLQCPSCRRALDRTERSVTCPRCHVSAAVCDGFVLWNERFLRVEDAVARSERVAGEGHRYDELLERRRARGHREPYAWFRPFNESSRSIDALRTLLLDTVRPGEPILDLWGRTGWTGEAMASWFPDNPVVSIWEGDRDQLGYQGYRRWLGTDQRAANLDIVFTTPADPLPFADGTFGFVHGLDTLHRYPHLPLMGECIRVATSDAPIVFPHIHLTNSEPDPWFERGCTQLHGRVWQDYLDRVGAATGRRAWVVAERDLYLLDEPRTLTADPDTPHYNGLAALGPTAWQDAGLERPSARVEPDAWILRNPLLSVDSVRGRAYVDNAGLDAMVGHMAERHPPAVAALAPLLERELTSRECQILAHCARPTTLSALADRLGTTVDALGDDCAALLYNRAIEIESITQAMAWLQHHYVTARPELDDSFGSLWRCLPARFGDRPVLVAADGSVLDVADTDVLVQAMRHWFSAQGMEPGDRVACCASTHLEYVLTAWAAWLSGLVLVTISPETSPDAIAAAVHSLDVTALCCDVTTGSAIEIADVATLTFDPIDDRADPSGDALLFADAIEPYLDGAALPIETTAGGDIAAIIMTSGSTGEPKAVALSMASLLHTADALGELLGLGPDDVFLSLAAPHTMSGVRNPLLASLRSGATLVVDAHAADSAFAMVDTVGRDGVTVAAGSPALVDRLAQIVDRTPAAALRTLRVLATTADQLDPAAAAEVHAHFGTAVIDYYGLTETGGLCVANTGTDGSLGKPWGAAVEVHIDGTRAPVGVTGELRVSGPGTMLGYLAEAQGVVVDDGWVHTGDLAIAHDDGSLSFVGRAVDMIKTRNGEIYPHRAVTELLAAEGIEATVSSDDRRAVVLHVAAHADADAVRLLIEARLGAASLPDRLEQSA